MNPQQKGGIVASCKESEDLNKNTTIASQITE